ncbi:unnamed protein product [Pylaiella littoralis]
MKAGHRSAVLAWYVAGSLLLLLCYCCCCYSFLTHHVVSSSTSGTTATSISEKIIVRNSRPPHSRHSPSIGRADSRAGLIREDVQGELRLMAMKAAAGAGLELSRPIAEVVLPPERGLRVHSMSDLHTDSKHNAAWVKTWASWKGYEAGELGEAHEDVLIVAGDVSSSLERSAETLTDLKERYDEVFFVVGNHEMWTGSRKRRTEEGGEGGGDEDAIDSVEKLVQMHRMCESLGVRTDPAIFVVGGTQQGGRAAGNDGGVAGAEKEAGEGGGAGRGGRQELAVFPLLSWYHASWDDEPNLPPELQLRRGDFLRRWRDFSLCHWPEDLCSREDFVTVDRDAPPVIAEFFARQNNACIEAFRSREEGGKASVAAAGLPRNGSGGCLEDKMEEEEEEGAAVGVGSESLRSVPSLPPSRGSSGTGGGSGGGGNGAEASTNVISFSHFVPRQELCPEKRLLWDPQLTKVIGSAPLERQIRELGSDVHIFGHTHIPIDMTSDGVRYVQWPLGDLREQSYRTNDMREKGPLLVYSHDGRQGGLRPPVHTLWGEFYEAYPRDPHDTDIPENTYEYMNERIKEGRRRAGASSS